MKQDKLHCAKNISLLKKENAHLLHTKWHTIHEEGDFRFLSQCLCHGNDNVMPRLQLNKLRAIEADGVYFISFDIVCYKLPHLFLVRLLECDCQRLLYERG